MGVIAEVAEQRENFADTITQINQYPGGIKMLFKLGLFCAVQHMETFGRGGLEQKEYQ